MRPVKNTPYDTLASDYDALFTRPRDLAENDELRRRLGRHNATEGRVLDVGCGTGFLLELCGLPPERYVGIDISDEMLAKAKAKFPAHTFEAQDMDCLGYLDESFDSVVALWSLSYSSDPREAVAEILRVLRPGGSIFVVVYAEWRGSESPLPYESWPEYSGTQRTLFSKRGLTELFGLNVDVSVRGLSSRHVPSFLSARFMRLESETIGRLFPNSCTYLTLMGSKSA